MGLKIQELIRNRGTCLNIGSCPMMIKKQLNTQGTCFENTDQAKVSALVSIYFSWNTKMCSGTTDCNGLSSTYSYVHHGTRMTVSFMFCALVASYGVRMVVRAVLVNHSGQSPLTLTQLIHEYHVDFPWKVCRPVASAAQH